MSGRITFWTNKWSKRQKNNTLISSRGCFWIWFWSPFLHLTCIFKNLDSSWRNTLCTLTCASRFHTFTPGIYKVQRQSATAAPLSHYDRVIAGEWPCSRAKWQRRGRRDLFLPSRCFSTLLLVVRMQEVKASPEMSLSWFWTTLRSWGCWLSISLHTQ